MLDFHLPRDWLFFLVRAAGTIGAAKGPRIDNQDDDAACPAFARQSMQAQLRSGQMMLRLACGGGMIIRGAGGRQFGGRTATH